MVIYTQGMGTEEGAGCRDVRWGFATAGMEGKDGEMR